MATMDRTELVQQTMRLISIAKQKGFDYENEIKPVMFEPWMPAAEIYCNTVCSVLAWWLREHHNIIVWMEQGLPGEYYSFVYSEVVGICEISKGEKYEWEWMIAIAFAIGLIENKSLPPAVPDKTNG